MFRRIMCWGWAQVVRFLYWIYRRTAQFLRWILGGILTICLFLGLLIGSWYFYPHAILVLDAWNFSALTWSLKELVRTAHWGLTFFSTHTFDNLLSLADTILGWTDNVSPIPDTGHLDMLDPIKRLENERVIVLHIMLRRILWSMMIIEMWLSASTLGSCIRATCCLLKKLLSRFAFGPGKVSQ